MHGIGRLGAALALGALLLAGGGAARAESAAEIDARVTRALGVLLASHPAVAALGREAKAVLVIPQLTRTGLLFAGQFGDGALRVGGKTEGYYRSVAASHGLAVGRQPHGYALFFRSQDALDHFRARDGWESGSGPDVLLVERGGLDVLTDTRARKDVYAFLFDAQGLLAGLDLEGTRVVRIRPGSATP